MGGPMEGGLKRCVLEKQLEKSALTSALSFRRESYGAVTEIRFSVPITVRSHCKSPFSNTFPTEFPYGTFQTILCLPFAYPFRLGPYLASRAHLSCNTVWNFGSRPPELTGAVAARASVARSLATFVQKGEMNSSAVHARGSPHGTTARANNHRVGDNFNFNRRAPCFNELDPATVDAAGKGDGNRPPPQPVAPGRSRNALPRPVRGVLRPADPGRRHSPARARPRAHRGWARVQRDIPRPLRRGGPGQGVHDEDGGVHDAGVRVQSHSGHVG
jgi:hypothetical protein